MKLPIRIHEWLADRISWVQYPKIRPANRRTAQAATMFRYSMPWPYRVAMLVGAVALLAICAAVFVPLAAVAWGVMS